MAAGYFRSVGFLVKKGEEDYIATEPHLIMKKRYISSPVRKQDLVLPDIISHGSVLVLKELSPFGDRPSDTAG